MSKIKFNIQLLAKIVGKQAGISVVFSESAPTASFNGLTKVMTLPSALCNSGTDSDVLLVRGFIAHEAIGHGIHTDIEAWMKIDDNFKRQLSNILEDIRIEKAAWAYFPGVRQILAETVDFFRAGTGDKDFFGQNLTDEEMGAFPPMSVFKGYLLTYLRATCLKQNLDYSRFKSLAEVMFGQSLIDSVTAIGIQSENSPSTAHIIGLAEKIIKLLQDEADKQPQPQPKNSSDKSGKQDSSDDGGEGEGEESGEPNGKASGESENASKGDKNDTGDDDKGEEKDKSKGGSDKDKPKDNPDSNSDSKSKDDSSDDSNADGDAKSGDDSQDDSTGDTGQPESTDGAEGDSPQQSNVKALLKEDADESFGDAGLEDLIAQAVQQVVNEVSDKRSNAGKFDAAVATITSTPVYDENHVNSFTKANSIKMSSKLEDLLESLTEESEVRSHVGRLDSRQLSKARLLETQMFVNDTSESLGLDTSLFILGDMSGSMSGEEAKWFMDTLLSLSTSLDRNNIPFGVSYFEDRAHEVKSFNERFQQVKGRIQQYYTPKGMTPIHDAMVYAAGKAIQTTSKRKILLVITDGAFSEAHINLEAFNRTLSTFRSDLEVRFVLIGNMQPTFDFLTKNQIVTGMAKNPKEICSAVFGALENVF